MFDYYYIFSRLMKQIQDYGPALRMVIISCFCIFARFYGIVYCLFFFLGGGRLLCPGFANFGVFLFKHASIL